MPILAFHRIYKNRAEDNLFNDKVIYPFENFKIVVDLLKKEFNIIKLEEYIEKIKKGIDTKNDFVLTFDDGYKEIYSNVFPYLIKNNMPAVFFIPSCVLGNSLLDWDRLSFVIKSTIKESIEINVLGKLNIRNYDEKIKCIAEIKKFLKNKSDNDKEKILKDIYSQAEIEINKKDHETLYINKEDLKEISRNELFDIGSHTMNHVILSRASENKREYEVMESKLFLENIIKKKIKYFAYPNGRICDFDDNDKEILKKKGYECAVTTENNLQDFDLYSLPRTCIEANDDPVNFVKYINLNPGLLEMISPEDRKIVLEFFNEVYCLFKDRIKSFTFLGSRLRKEDIPTSDYDFITVLDKVETEDLIKMRSVLKKRKNFGSFFWSENDLKSLPYTLFVFFDLPMVNLYGKLKKEIPTRENRIEFIKVMLRLIIDNERHYHLFNHSDHYVQYRSYDKIKDCIHVIRNIVNLMNGSLAKSRQELKIELSNLGFSRDSPIFYPIDILENWHNDKKSYVKNSFPLIGKINDFANSAQELLIKIQEQDEKKKN